MSAVRPATTAEFAGYMEEVRAQLPPQWETDGLWQLHADELARFIAEQAGRFPVEGALLLIGIGGIMLAMAEREREAAAVALAVLKPRHGDAA